MDHQADVFEVLPFDDMTMSVMWVSRLISLLMKCERSPTPVSVDVNTLWPCCSSKSDNPPPVPGAMPGAVHEHESLALRGPRPGRRAAERRRTRAGTGACEHGAAGVRGVVGRGHFSMEHVCCPSPSRKDGYDASPTRACVLASPGPPACQPKPAGRGAWMPVSVPVQMLA
jgi:hypothetical protein